MLERDPLSNTKHVVMMNYFCPSKKRCSDHCAFFFLSVDYRVKHWMFPANLVKKDSYILRESSIERVDT